MPLKLFILNGSILRNSFAIQWLVLRAFTAFAWGRSVVGEQIPKPRGVAKKEIKWIYFIVCKYKKICM